MGDKTALRDLFLVKIAQCISKTDNTEIDLETRIIDVLPPDMNVWKLLENCLQLKIPQPRGYLPDKSIYNKMLQLVTKPTYEVTVITFSRFADAICAANYRNLISGKTITSKHEIYVAISGLLADICGVDLFGILPESKFVDDLGID